MTNPKFFLIASLILISSLSWAQDAESYLRTGNQAFRNQEYPQARANYQKALNLDPNLTQAYHNLGNVDYLLQDYKAAAQHYDQAVRLDPEQAEPRVSRGALYYAQYNYEAALVDLNKAIYLNPGLPDAHYLRGLVYEAQNKIDLACEDWKQAAALGNQPAQLKVEEYCGKVNNRPKSRGNKNNISSRKDFAQPQSAEDYIKRAEHKLELRYYEAAALDFEKAIELEPRNGKAFYGRAAARFAKGDHKGACEDWHTSLDLGYKDAEEMIQLSCHHN